MASKELSSKGNLSESPKISVASFPSLFFAISSILGDISIANSCSAIFNSFISLSNAPVPQPKSNIECIFLFFKFSIIGL